MFENEKISMVIGRQKNIALIAHDSKKHDMIDWCKKNKSILECHFLCGTGTTARMVAEETGLPVRGYNSGPLGGDQQIGALVATEQVQFVIFLRDPLTSQPHEPDINALLRLCDVHNIPLATNRKSAHILLSYLAEKGRESDAEA